MKTAAPAMSSGLPNLPISISARLRARRSGCSVRARRGVMKCPALMQFTRIVGAHSFAMLRVRCITDALVML